MTKKELIEALHECVDEGREEGHMQADRLLLKYINDEDISVAWEKLRKWFS